jgi:uncharacterized 2Fe-2S/4Fe-4S cluster protein (DUF4445 family)
VSKRGAQQYERFDMVKQSVRVLIKPDNKEVWVVTGSTVSDALFAASIPITMPCGVNGRCGKCVVLVKGGVLPADEDEKRRIRSRKKGARLACRTRITGDCEVTIPAETRITIQKIETRGKVSHDYALAPSVYKLYLGEVNDRYRRGLDTLESTYGITAREVALKMTDPNLLDDSLLHDPEYLMGEHNRSTIVAGRRDIMAFEAGDTSDECYGVAFDVGTNTIVASVIDLVKGREVGSVSTINPQVTHGDDVVSRIRFAKSAGGLDLMRHEVGNAMNGLLEAMLKKFKIDGRLLYACTAVGNTVMQHILVGVSPEGLGRAPYRAKLMSAVETLASRTGVGGHHSCRLFVPAPIGGFVGGDIIALIISQSLHTQEKPVLGIDIGTNGEIVLAAGGRLVACSTAAGPAFEGERISSGVRAIEGAVERMKLEGGRITLKTIGGRPPIGLCGSGVISCVAELLRKKVIEPSGRIRLPEEIKDRNLARRIVAGAGGREFVIKSRPDIRMRQGDVREVQLGKAAISAGIKMLCSIAGVDLDSISTVYVAGGFGSSLRGSDLKRLGLLPVGLGGHVKVVGNAAIEGAKILLTSLEARDEAGRIARETRHVELFSESAFNEEFYRSMEFPG